MKPKTLLTHAPEVSQDEREVIDSCLRATAQVYVSFFVPEVRSIRGGYNAPCPLCEKGILHIGNSEGKTHIVCTGGCKEHPIARKHILRTGLEKVPEYLDFVASIDPKKAVDEVTESQATEPIEGQPTAWPSVLRDAALHGFIGDMVRTIGPHTEADPAALVFQFFAAFGNCLGRKPYYQVEASRHRGNVFACIVGQSSKSRKGTSWDHIKRLVESACPQWVEERIKSGLSSGEGLINEVRDQDGTEDKRLLSVESEFASVLRVIEREGNTISARIRDAFDGGRLYTMTKHNPLKATGAHISIIGHCTVEELRRYLTRTELGNGFANRFLWVCAKRSKLLPDGGNLKSHELKPLTDHLREAITFATDTEEVTRDLEARKLWHQVYPHLSRETPHLLGSVISRAEAQVTRLAMLYALLDCSNVIRREHLEAALALWDYAEASARYVFGDATGDTVADNLLALLKASPNGVDKETIHRHFSNNLSAHRLKAALELLTKSGRVRRVSRTSASGMGRPSDIWHYVPWQYAGDMLRRNEENEEIATEESGDIEFTSLNSSFVALSPETEMEEGEL